MYVSALHVNGFMSAAMCVFRKVSTRFCSVCVNVYPYAFPPPVCVCVCVCACVRVCVCAFRAISKEANSLVDRNCYGLEVEPLAAVMQVEPHKPHQSQQRHNEAELPNRATPATMRLLLPW